MFTRRPRRWHTKVLLRVELTGVAVNGKQPWELYMEPRSETADHRFFADPRLVSLDTGSGREMPVNAMVPAYDIVCFLSQNPSTWNRRIPGVLQFHS